MMLTSRQSIVGKTKDFASLAAAHLRIYWFTYALLWCLCLLVEANYRVGINQTASLPQSLFLIHRGQVVNRGDFVTFYLDQAAAKHFKTPNPKLTKIVVGVPGDRVTVSDRVVFINGSPVGYAKPTSMKGEALEPIAGSIIQAGKYYVMGLHKDSFDSRYSLVGLVDSSMIVGRSYPIF